MFLRWCHLVLLPLSDLRPRPRSDFCANPPFLLPWLTTPTDHTLPLFPLWGRGTSCTTTESSRLRDPTFGSLGWKGVYHCHSRLFERVLTLLGRRFTLEFDLEFRLPRSQDHRTGKGRGTSSWGNVKIPRLFFFFLDFSGPVQVNDLRLQVS